MQTIRIPNHYKVREWVKTGETDTLEFKERISEAFKVAKTICAFANTRGGFLITGITDDGLIVGVIDPEAEKQLLIKAATLYCFPPVDIVFWEYTEDFLVVLAAEIAESKQKPHKAMLKNGTEQTYIRTGNKTMPAGKLVEKVLRNEQMEEIAASKTIRTLDSKEQGLLTYLAKNETATLKQFARLVNISERRARRMLVQLTLEGLIRLHTTHKEDYYTLA